MTKVMQDAEGHPFTATVTNYSGPAGTQNLSILCRPKKGIPTPDDTGKPTPTPTPVTPKDVRDKAKKLNPQSSGGGNAKFGPPDTSIQMKTPAITKLGQQHDAAVELVSEAEDAVKNPDNGELQFLLVDNLLHGALGRVNEIEINRIQNRGGWFMAPDRWEAEAKSGTLAPQLIQQLYDFTVSQQRRLKRRKQLIRMKALAA